MLIVVAIIGIIVAMAVANLVSAVQRAKQKRSMGDMRTVALAIESFTTDFNRYPALRPASPAVGTEPPDGHAGAIVPAADADVSQDGPDDGRLELVVHLRG